MRDRGLRSAHGQQPHSPDNFSPRHLGVKCAPMHYGQLCGSRWTYFIGAKISSFEDILGLSAGQYVFQTVKTPFHPDHKGPKPPDYPPGSSKFPNVQCCRHASGPRTRGKVSPWTRSGHVAWTEISIWRGHPGRKKVHQV